MSRPVLLAVLIASVSTADAGIIVDSTHVIDYAGVIATPGQVVQITATGQIDMAYDNGHYVTKPDGTILVAPTGPAPGGGVYVYMLGETGGIPAAAGGVVNIHPMHGDDLGQLVGSPYGALIAGFSTTLTPTSLADFTSGFKLIGASGSITSPVGAPYLFLSINDTFRSDNLGSYEVSLLDAHSIPEPASLTLFSLGALGLAGAARRRRQDA